MEAFTKYSWLDCDALIEFYLVEGGGHTWPGAIPIDTRGRVRGRAFAAAELNRIVGPARQHGHSADSRRLFTDRTSLDYRFLG